MKHRKLSQHGSLLEGSRLERYGSPRLIPGLRPQIVPPPSGPFGRKSLEALPASGPFYSPTFLTPLPLPRPSSPSASAQVSGSPVAPSGGKASAGHSGPDLGAGPSPQAHARRRPRPWPSALSPGASAPPHSQEEAHLLASEGRGGAAGPRRGQESEPAREPTGSRRVSDLGPRRQRPPLLRAEG